MKYRIVSIDTHAPTGHLYIVVDFLTDTRGQVQREDFVIGRPAFTRRYVGSTPENPDPADYVEEKADVAGEITAVIERYWRDHPELDDARLRDEKFRAVRVNPRIAQAASRTDPYGHLADSAVAALVGSERDTPRRGQVTPR